MLASGAQWNISDYRPSMFPASISHTKSATQHSSRILISSSFFSSQSLSDQDDPTFSLLYRDSYEIPAAEDGPRTLYDKAFHEHIVDEELDGTILLYIGK